MLFFKGKTRSGIGLNALLRCPRTDGICIFYSGRLTLCNRHFLRENTAIIREVHQPIPSASLPCSTLPAATEGDTPDVALRPSQINRDQVKHPEELPLGPTCNVQPPNVSFNTAKLFSYFHYRLVFLLVLKSSCLLKVSCKGFTS